MTTLIVVLIAVFFAGMVVVLFVGAGRSDEWDEMTDRQRMTRALNNRRRDEQ